MGKETNALGPLSWEDLKHHSGVSAFFSTSYELLLHPIRFARKMSPDGGLHEPLLLLWIFASIAVLASFPLTLIYFQISAPAPATISAHTYALHLLPLRVAGILAIILPLMLFSVGIMAIFAGTLFFLAGSFFGLQDWEATVSALAYAIVGALLSFVTFEGLWGGLIFLLYLINWMEPTYSEVVSEIASTSLIVGGICCVISSLFLFFLVLGSCITEIFQLDATSSIAAILSGLILSCVVFIGPVVSSHIWGLTGFGVSLAAVIVLLATLWISGWLLKPILILQSQ